jgi:hypothetical protein
MSDNMDKAKVIKLAFDHQLHITIMADGTIKGTSKDLDKLRELYKEDSCVLQTSSPQIS